LDVREPAWLWVLPGVLGAAVLTTFTFSPPRIGTLATFVLLITGQLFASVVIDSAGLFGVERIPLSGTRV
jgi:bacterial/archaeal transporter family-2 protein